MTYYTFLFSFEKDWDPVPAIGFYQKYWSSSIVLSGIYLLAIYFGQKWMKHRPEYHLKPILIAWNGLIAAFSTLGAIRFAPHFFGTLRTHGLIYTICTIKGDVDYKNQAAGFWMCMFGFSKAVEFGDTALLILRKRKVIFLHWYHHVTVLIYTWHGLSTPIASGRWFVMLNYAVHSVMYSYYALSACGCRFPKWARMSITIQQLSQMAVGIWISILVFWQQISGQKCSHATYASSCMALLMYLSYLALFCHFFYKAYILPAKRPHRKKTQ